MLQTPVRPSVSARTSRILTCVIIALTAGLAYAWTNADAEHSATHTRLVVSPHALDLGEVAMSHAFTWTLPVQNPTHQEISIAAWDSSCGCAEISPKAVSIPRRDVMPVTLTLDLTTQHAEEAIRPFRPFRVVLHPVVDSGAHPGWRIHGVVRQPFAAIPNKLSFGGADAIVQGMPSAGRPLTIQTHGAIVRAEVECVPPVGDVEVARQGDNFTATFTPSQALARGYFDAHLVITGFGKAQQPVGRLRVPISGEVVPRVSLVPAAINFASCIVGRAAEQSVVLESRNGTAFEVDDIPAKPFISVSRSTNQPAARHVLRVMSRAERQGDRQIMLKVPVRFTDGAADLVELPVRIHARNPREVLP